MSEMTTAASKKSSVLEDVLEIIWAPATVFERARNNGIGMYILVLSIACAVVVLGTKGLIQPYMDANFDLQMKMMAAKGRPMPENAVEMSRKFGNYAFLASSVLMVPLGALISGFLLWLSAKIVKAPLVFKQAALIATLAMVPRVFSFIAMAVQGALADTNSIKSLYDASLGPARFVNAETTAPALIGLLANLDLFSLWQVVLYAIGVSVVARVARSSGWVAAVVAWGLGALATLIPAALFG
jgi:hypothetical protein